MADIQPKKGTTQCGELQVRIHLQSEVCTFCSFPIFSDSKPADLDNYMYIWLYYKNCISTASFFTSCINKKQWTYQLFMSKPINLINASGSWWPSQGMRIRWASTLMLTLPHVACGRIHGWETWYRKTHGGTTWTSWLFILSRWGY